MSGLTPIRSIRAKCIDCSGGSKREVRLCSVRTCPSWPYRLGRRPRVGSEEEKVHEAMGKLKLDVLADARRTERLLQVEDPS